MKLIDRVVLRLVAWRLRKLAACPPVPSCGKHLDDRLTALLVQRLESINAALDEQERNRVFLRFEEIEPSRLGRPT